MGVIALCTMDALERQIMLAPMHIGFYASKLMPAELCCSALQCNDFSACLQVGGSTLVTRGS